MASDISTLFEEQICNTLETALSVICTIENSYNIDENYIHQSHFVSIDGNLICEDKTLHTKFLLPTQLSNFIFNTMMMEDGDLDVELTDDTADAIKEIVGQIGGSLATAVNGSAFDDITGCKFEVGDTTIVDGKQYQLNHKPILLQLKINDNTFDIILDFDETSLEFIQKLLSSDTLEVETTTQEEEEIESTEEESENQEEDKNNNDNTDEDINSTEEETPTTQEKTEEEETQKEDSSDDTKETATDEKSENKESKDKDTKEEPQEELTDEQKKEKKLKLFVYIVAGLLGVVIIAFGVLFYMGAFDEPKPVVKKVKKIKKPTNKNIIIDVKHKEINFKMDMINVKRLNRRLSFLTKYDILNDDALEKFKQKEKERLYQLKMKRLEEFAARNKEESIYKKNGILIDDNHPITNTQKEILDSQELVFIQIPSLKYKKYKNIIKKEQTKNIQISICKNSHNKIDVYVGPIFIKAIVNNIIKDINNKQDARIVILTKKEFNKRCDF